MAKSPTEEAAELIWTVEEKFRERQKDMREHGVVELGGESLAPSHLMSYLRASEILFEQAGSELTDIALPLLYLYRHAFELVLKRSINTCADIANFKRRLEKADGGAKTQELLHVNSGHKLQKLAQVLRNYTTVLSIKAPLDEIDSFAMNWESIIEKNDPTRLRYERDAKKQPSFSKDTKATIGLHGKHKEFMELMAKLVPVRGGNQDNLCMRLLVEWVKLEAKCNQLKEQAG